MQSTSNAMVLEKSNATENVLRPLIARHFFPIIALVAINFAFFSPVLRHNLSFSMVGPHLFAQYPWAAIAPRDGSFVGDGYPQTDQAEGLYPTAVTATFAFKQGELPIWDPWSLSGVPTAELSMGGNLYPPRLLMMLFLSPISQHDGLLILHMFLASLGMYALMRYWGANVWGALLAAVVWEFNGHLTFYMVLEFLPVCSAILPFCLLAAAVAIDKRSILAAAVAGSLAALLMFAGNLHWCLLGLFVLTVLYGIKALSVDEKLNLNNRLFAWRTFSLPVFSAVICVVGSAAVWLPIAGWLPDVHRVPLTLEQQISGGLPLKNLLRTLFMPERAFHVGSVVDASLMAYVSIACLIFAPLAFLRRSYTVWLMVVLAFISILISIGFSPAIRMLRLIPFGGTFQPHRWLYVFCFAMAVLGGLGLSNVTRFWEDYPSKLPARILGISAVAIAAAQLILFARQINPLHQKTESWLYPETPVIKAAKEAQGEYRGLPIYFRANVWYPGALIAKVPDIFQLRTGGGYSSLTPLNVALLWRTVEKGGVPATRADLGPIVRPLYAHDLLSISLLEKLSVRYVISGPGVQPKCTDGSDPITLGKMKQIYDGPDGRLFEIPAAVPRAFIVPRLRRVSDDEAALKELCGNDFDVRREALVTDTSPLIEKDGTGGAIKANAQIIQDGINVVQVRTESEGDAFLVLNDTWAPGWKAYVDGNLVPVTRANFNFRVVPVKKGEHLVKFVYAPWQLTTGIAVSLLTFFSVILACCVKWYLNLRSRRALSTGDVTPQGRIR